MAPENHPQATSEYREFPPPLPLADYFLCFWTQTVSGAIGEYAHQVLPDGCVDIVFVNQDAPVAVLIRNKTEPWGQTVSRFIDADGLLIGLTFTPWLREKLREKLPEKK
jgi:hypothetical protein